MEIEHNVPSDDNGLRPALSSPCIDKICAALAKAQGQIGNVKKNGKNTFFNNAPYALYEDIVEAIQPAASANGLATIRRFEDNAMHTILVHESGQWIDYGRYNLGVFSKHQERGSAITYAKRYVDSGIYGVAPEVDDDGNAGNVPAKDSKVAVKPPPAKAPIPKPDKPNAEEAPVIPDMYGKNLAKSLPPVGKNKTARVEYLDGTFKEFPSLTEAGEALSIHMSEYQPGPDRFDILERNGKLKAAFLAKGAEGTAMWGLLVEQADNERA